MFCERCTARVSESAFMFFADTVRQYFARGKFPKTSSRCGSVTLEL
jgi:hypothetical protein